ncbi:Deleted in autism protein 1 [Blattella germanica]|nr:Deleted in autism protein 1 [Blattella germanica]
MKGTVLFLFLAFVVGIKLLEWPSATYLLELNKCPACYGTSLCEAFVTKNITLDFYSIKALIFNLFGSKNVLFGIYLNERIVLKKLGDRTELDKLDATVCIMKGLAVGCQVGEALKEQDNLLHKLEKQVIQPYGSSLHLCPSSAHLNVLITNYEESKDSTSRNVFLGIIWTVISVNPEPLILQILRAENGWPVPKYKGACGRIIVEEYVGEMLYMYHRAPWLQRASFAFQLLMAALNFTNDHPDFSFYLTDISPDNIAVDSYGKIKFIDLENVIVVNKNINEEGLYMDKIRQWHLKFNSVIVINYSVYVERK